MANKVGWTWTVCAESCRFRFYGNLNDFLPATLQYSWIDYSLDGTVAVKHPIEALGVPHPEVEQILVGDSLVGFGHHLGVGEDVRVFPLDSQTLVQNPTSLRPPLTGPTRFVLDTHLGRLAAYLRMLGIDTVYRNDSDDAELATIASEDGRVLLTRDRGLLKRKIVVYGYCVRQTEPRAQFVDAVRRYQLSDEAVPWSRCVRCNGLLESVEKAEIMDQLEPKTKQYYDKFQQCTSCGQIYWRGSHHVRMREFLASVLVEACQSSHKDMGIDQLPG